jgi:hypothetical protein
MNDEPGVWVFNGSGGQFPSAVFSTIELADTWVAKHRLSGVLTWYPLDIGVYEWVIGKEYWQPRSENQRSSEFIQRFSSAYTGHYHYENGSRDYSAQSNGA